MGVLGEELEDELEVACRTLSLSGKTWRSNNQMGWPVNPKFQNPMSKE